MGVKIVQSQPLFIRKEEAHLGKNLKQHFPSGFQQRQFGIWDAAYLEPWTMPVPWYALAILLCFHLQLHPVHQTATTNFAPTTAAKPAAVSTFLSLAHPSVRRTACATKVFSWAAVVVSQCFSVAVFQSQNYPPLPKMAHGLRIWVLQQEPPLTGRKSTFFSSSTLDTLSKNQANLYSIMASVSTICWCFISIIFDYEPFGQTEVLWFIYLANFFGLISGI